VRRARVTAPSDGWRDPRAFPGAGAAGFGPQERREAAPCRVLLEGLNAPCPLHWALQSRVHLEKRYVP